MRSGTPLARLRERERRSVAPARLAYLKERGLEVAVEQVQVAAESAQTDAGQALQETSALQDHLDDVLTPQVQGLAAGVYVAQATSNTAIALADAAGGGGAASGSATNPAVDLTTDGVWVPGPVVSLTGVVAGDLTLTGSGPIQDDDVSLLLSASAAGEYRLVEVIGGIDEVLLTQTFTVNGSGSPATVTNGGASSVAAYVSSRSSTGAVDYRIDARKTSGAVITSLSLYIYARRAA